MKHRLLMALCLSLFLINSEGFCAPQRKKDIKRVSTIAVIPASRIPRFKLNTQFGFNLLFNSAVVSGFQFGRLVSSKSKLYVGPELNFMLFSPGSILNVLLGGWFENDWFENPRKKIDLGFAVGVGFADRVSKLKTSNLVTLLDIAYNQHVDDSLSIRGQIRPGLFNGSFFTNLSFSAQFVFP